ncbi:hypothetical protein niasHT_019920 [Heterodera trifolii]|uniref:Large ribosomal subunit protein bL28m n=1 Tax=Heterodera trifolii TaxID=157864 RepID=A0ABD2L8U3_9BILA
MSFAKSCSLAKHCKPLTAAPPRPVITWDKHERIRRNKEIWDNPKSVVHRLPRHYQERYWKNFVLADQTAVNYKVPPFRFYWDEHWKIELETEYFPILPIHCPEMDQGLWAGEGIIKGYSESDPKIKKKVLPRNWLPRLWIPHLNLVPLYSEVLDKYFKVTVTERLLRAVDKHFGFDLYLLETPDIDINSRLGLDLKRLILVKLAEKGYYPDDQEQREYICDKYADYVLPLEEADWYGLELNTACRKLQDLEDNTRAQPMKYAFEKELMAQLQREAAADGTEKQRQPTKLVG